MKVMERLLLWELEATTLKDNPLHKYQFAFKRGVSTETALSRVVDFLEGGIYRGLHALAIFFDIESAFDSISVEAIINQMEARGFPIQFIKFYKGV